MSLITKIFQEIKKQIGNSPSDKSIIQPNTFTYLGYLDEINQQIEKAIKNSKSGLIFLVGPYGSGKTTHLNYFLSKHTFYRHEYKSFEKIENLEFAFLHLTGFLSRIFFICLASFFAYEVMTELPTSAALSFTFILGYFFCKKYVQFNLYN